MVVYILGSMCILQIIAGCCDLMLIQDLCHWNMTYMNLFYMKKNTKFQNIRVMAKYYTRIRMKKMSDLLDLPESVSRFVAVKSVGV